MGRGFGVEGGLAGNTAAVGVHATGHDAHMQVARRTGHEQSPAAVARTGVDPAHDQVAGADHAGRGEEPGVDGLAVIVGDDGHIHFPQPGGVLRRPRRLPHGQSPAGHRGRRPSREEGGVGGGGKGDGQPGGGRPLQPDQGQVVGREGVGRMPVHGAHPDTLTLGVFAEIMAADQHIESSSDTVAGGEHPLRGDERPTAVEAPVGITLRRQHQGDNERVRPRRVDLSAADDAGDDASAALRSGRGRRGERPGGREKGDAQAGKEDRRPASASGHDRQP